MAQDKQTIGVLTIGQSPRVDVVPSIREILGPNIILKEAGGLDRLCEDDLPSISPDKGETTYISRLRNGSSVKIGKSKLLPLLQDELSKLEEEATVIIMLCTGDFPSLKARKPILYPDKILNSTVNAIMQSGKLGLIIPLEEQRTSLVQKWHHLDVLVEVASPYEESDIFGAACRLKERGASMLVLDCIGYNDQHKLKAVKGSGLPVILPRTLTARIAAEYFL